MVVSVVHSIDIFFSKVKKSVVSVARTVNDTLSKGDLLLSPNYRKFLQLQKELKVEIVFRIFFC